MRVILSILHRGRHIACPTTFQLRGAAKRPSVWVREDQHTSRVFDLGAGLFRLRPTCLWHLTRALHRVAGVPLVKIISFSRLLPSPILKGKDEFLVLDDGYRVKTAI
jgi:hypothetical protein